MYDYGAKSSEIRELFEYGKKRKAEIGQENVFDFSIGNPTVPAPACVKEAIEDIMETRESAAIHGYTAAAGDTAVRQGLADFMNQTYDAQVRADNFYMTCGAAASLTISLKALVESPDDEIILIAPFFPEYTVFVQNANAKSVVLPPDTEHFQISLDALEKAITPHTRAVIINSPNNPSGVVYSADTYEKLAALLTRKSQEIGHAIYIISDEPYREIIYDGLPILYVPKFYKDTIICYSYSKSFSLAGERIGYIVVPNEVSEFADIYAAVAGAARVLTHVNAPSLFQKVVARCAGKPSDISIYEKNRELLYNGLVEAGIACVKPEGAFYLFPRTLEEDDRAFCEKAKAYDLLLVPGSDFGCPGHFRASYCIKTSTIEKSLPVFKKFVKEVYGI